MAVERANRGTRNTEKNSIREGYRKKSYIDPFAWYSGFK